jgi:hypothetical protein
MKRRELISLDALPLPIWGEGWGEGVRSPSRLDDAAILQTLVDEGALSNTRSFLTSEPRGMRNLIKADVQATGLEPGSTIR